jgi:hypothetical protein
MAQLVSPGDEIQVRVYKLQRPGLYRFPVHLELLTPVDWVPKITSPAEWESPIDMRWAQAQGWDLDRILAETGRTYVRASYYLQVGCCGVCCWGCCWGCWGCGCWCCCAGDAAVAGVVQACQWQGCLAQGCKLCKPCKHQRP